MFPGSAFPTPPRTEAGALLRTGLDLVRDMPVPEGKRLIGAVVVDGDQRVIGFAAKLPKGWELHGQVSQQVQDGKKGIRVAAAVVF